MKKFKKEHQKIRFFEKDFLHLSVYKLICPCFLWKICKKRKKEKSRIEILNVIYDEGTTRISKEFSLERLIKSTREMKIYMKKNGLEQKTRLKIA